MNRNTIGASLAQVLDAESEAILAPLEDSEIG
jgi:hypothetical protein